MGSAVRPYTLRSIKVGCEAIGIDLSGHVSKEIIHQIIKDVEEHKIVVFKKQGNITPERHLEIGLWFGEIESTFYNHDKSPHRDIFRVSNDRAEGCTNVGRTGWHIDGSFMQAPFSHSLYHIISVPSAGTTSFLPLTDFILSVDQETRKLWECLWMVSDSRDIVHPLIYNHPDTGHPVLCFHLGMTGAFVKNYGTDQQSFLSPSETKHILKTLHDAILRSGLIYHHKYEEGDFIISDNLAVGHEASPETQLPRSQVGLRVMHRVTIAGKHRPSK